MAYVYIYVYIFVLLCSACDYDGFVSLIMVTNY